MAIQENIRSLWEQVMMGKAEDCDHSMAVQLSDKHGPRVYIFFFNLSGEFQKSQREQLQLLTEATKHMAEVAGVDPEELSDMLQEKQ